MRKIFCLFTCVMFGFFLGTAQAQLVENNPLQNYNNINLVFLQSAQSAILQSIPSQPGYYTLTLYNLNPYTTYYSARPNRVSGIVPTINFVKAWEVGGNNFKTNNPNATIIPATVDGVLNKSISAKIVTLSSPEYDQEKSIIRYVVKPLPSEHFIFDQLEYGYVTILID